MYSLYFSFLFSLSKSQFKKEKDRLKKKKVYRVSFHFLSLSLLHVVSINHLLICPSIICFIFLLFFYNLSMGMSSCVLKNHLPAWEIEFMIFFTINYTFVPWIEFIMNFRIIHFFFFCSCSLVSKSCSSLTQWFKRFETKT